MFVPGPLKNIQVDKQTVKLYPIVDLSMKPPKRAHAFQTNKTALSIPGIDRRTMLDTLGVQLNLSAIVDDFLGDWTSHFHRNWCNFAHLTILSFHGDAGTQVNETSDANDSAVLLPMVNGPLGNCCKQVRFVRVQLNLDFTSLVPHGVQGLTILRVEFYIELPQSSGDMINDNNQSYRLTTWLGNADLRAIAAANFACDVLAHTLQDGPIDLLRPDFNLTSAKTARATSKRRSAPKSSASPLPWSSIPSSISSARGIQRSLMPLSTMSGRPTTIRMVTRCFQESTTITLRSLPHLARSST